MSRPLFLLASALIGHALAQAHATWELRARLAHTLGEAERTRWIRRLSALEEQGLVFQEFVAVEVRRLGDGP